MSATVSLRQIIADAKMILGLTSSDQDTFLYKLASDAARQIESTENILPLVQVLQIDNATAFLPSGVVMIRAVRLTTSNGWCYPVYVDSLFPFDKDCYNSTEFGYNNIDGYSFAIQDECLIFSSNINIDQCEVSYYGLALDADGFPLITEYMELAVQSYMVWKFMMANFKLFPRDIRQDYKDEWRLNLMKCRSQPPQNYLLQDIGAAWNRFTVRSFGNNRLGAPMAQIGTGGIV